MRFSVALHALPAATAAHGRVVDVHELHAEQAGLPAIFKASFDKANRTSSSSFRGPGLSEGLRILAAVKAETGLPVLTDIHEPAQAGPAAEVCEVLQIPAFLCRQTDLLVEAGRTGRVVNIKKGQFLAPWDLVYAADKVRSGGSERILLTERGSSFGYQNLVVDFRGLKMMRDLGYPVVLDVTHSLQLPGAAKGKSGGQPEYIETLARAGVAAGPTACFSRRTRRRSVRCPTAQTRCGSSCCPDCYKGCASCPTSSEAGRRPSSCVHASSVGPFGRRSLPWFSMGTESDGWHRRASLVLLIGGRKPATPSQRN